jgi:D-alanyl-D-alanine carboxypeptidase
MKIPSWLSIILVVLMLEPGTSRAQTISNDRVMLILEQYAGRVVPGLQYVVVDANGVLFEYVGGFADLRHRRVMTLDTTLMAYSMTKTFAAVAILQLAEQEKISLDDLIDSYLPANLYGGHGITIRHLLDHTSGIPNPIPLRWVHLVEEREHFDEDAALAKVIRENPKLSSIPGRKYAYSNIGYWLLGKVVEGVSGQSFGDYVRDNILQRLGISPEEMDFVISDPARHAKGYLARYSLLNLVKRFVIDEKFFGEYEGKWLRINDHYLNGPAFGGLVGTARGFSLFLQDQLRPTSVLFAPETKSLLEIPQTDSTGKPIPMTLGWHIRELNNATYFFKEGGGGGFHAEMRIYPAKGIGSVVMVNDTGFNSTKFLDRMDHVFIKSREESIHNSGYQGQ